MGFWAPFAASAVGGIASSLLGNAGARRQQESANSWTKMMSDTAHQREVKDLQAAGLNPILSAGGNGSSSPSASPAPVTAPQIDMPSVYHMALQQDQLKLEKQKVENETASTTAGIAKTLSDTELNKARKILAQKGMLKANMEGEASSVLSDIIKGIKKQFNNNSPPNSSQPTVVPDFIRGR